LQVGNAVLQLREKVDGSGLPFRQPRRWSDPLSKARRTDMSSNRHMSVCHTITAESGFNEQGPVPCREQGG
jgi:hypothetical protein